MPTNHLRETVRQLISARPECRSFLHLGLGVVAVILIGYTLLFAVSWLPQSGLRWHIHQAQEQGYFTENYPRPPYYLHYLNKQLDMYTECVGLGIAVNMRPEMERLLSMPTFGECEGLTRAAVYNFEVSAGSYMRYLHGYQAFLKPLYTFFAIDTVRIITGGITVSLLALLFVTLRSHLNTAYATVVVLSFFITRSSHVFLLVTHAAQFWLVLVGAILVVRLRNRAAPLVLFGIIGACDTFFSFLNMGSLSLGLPLLCYALAQWKDGRRPSEIIAALFWAGIGWSIGFVALWLIKWTTLGLVLHPTKAQLFGSTLDAYPPRNVGMILTALTKNYKNLQRIILLTVCVILIAIRIWRRPKTPSGLWAALLPALVPVIWMCVLPGQSGIHQTFVNVILWPNIAALFLLLLALPKPQQRE